MNQIQQIAQLGGIFAILTLVHFFVDWIFQSHAEAMVKHNNAKIRAKHCLIYTIGFIPLLFLLHFSLIKFVIALNILFWSHFVEDTYYIVYLWAKYIRRPPQMTDPWKEEIPQVDNVRIYKLRLPDAKRGFKQFIQTPIGLVLMITIDQIIHLLFLIPVAWMALN